VARDLADVPFDELLLEVERRRAQLVAEAIDRPSTSSPGWVPLSSLGLPIKSLRAAVRRGELVVRRVGRADFVERVAVDAWVASRTSETPPVGPVDDDDDPIERALASGALRRVGSNDR
jgi:hypothetical protein